jgi:hypothetical protein
MVKDKGYPISSFVFGIGSSLTTLDRYSGKEVNKTDIIKGRQVQLAWLGEFLII